MIYSIFPNTGFGFTWLAADPRLQNRTIHSSLKSRSRVQRPLLCCTFCTCATVARSVGLNWLVNRSEALSSAQLHCTFFFDLLSFEYQQPTHLPKV